MKIGGICLFLVCCAVTMSYGETPSAASQQDQPTAPDSYWKADPFILNPDPDRPQLKDSEANSDNYCAYMRTYRVKRKYRRSDVVGPAGYTTCVPTKRFEMRSAVQTEREQAGSK